jgi:hypothetical protein
MRTLRERQLASVRATIDAIRSSGEPALANTLTVLLREYEEQRGGSLRDALIAAAYSLTSADTPGDVAEIVRAMMDAAGGFRPGFEELEGEEEMREELREHGATDGGIWTYLSKRDKQDNV